MGQIIKSLALLAAIWVLLGASTDEADKPINIGLAPNGFTQKERAATQFVRANDEEYTGIRRIAKDLGLL
jgi:hypothetical protein